MHLLHTAVTNQIEFRNAAGSDMKYSTVETLTGAINQQLLEPDMSFRST